MQRRGRAGGAGHLPEHSTDAAAAMTENNIHPRREYNKVELEASVGGQASVGPATEEDSHGATRHIERTHWEEGGDKNPRRASSEREPADGETEEIPPPERMRAPNASGRQRGEGEGGTPTQQRMPMARSEGSREDPREYQQETPPREGGTGTQRGAPSELSGRGSPMDEGR